MECWGLNEKCPHPARLRHKHLVHKQCHYLGKFWNLQEVQTSWRKTVSADRRCLELLLSVSYKPLGCDLFPHTT